MDEEVMDEAEAMKALAAITTARTHAAACRHGPATALLMQALSAVPQLADELEAELTFSLKAYGEELASKGQANNAIWLYSQALPLLPRPCGLHTNLGGLYYALGSAGAAIKSFSRALELEPGYWPALESLENVKSLAVDRWHYRMLNHSARNEAYSRAIERAVAAAASRSEGFSAGVTVLDIGTGTGILAVMAARAGASRVFACEINGVLCNVAREVLERNGVADRVTVINKSSAALEPGVDLPAKGVDVIVTELVDSGLLGERIIPVLCDARARGLLAEGGQVVPEGARVYGAVVESEVIRRRSRLLPESLACLRTGNVSITVEESYTCEDLSRVEHRLLTSPTAVLDVDFLKDGAAIMMPSWSPPRAPSPGLCLPIRRTGHADAVAVWFDLWLDNEREECDVVSTRSERCRRVDDASGWDAGIYFTDGVELHEGHAVALRASAGRDRLHISVDRDEGAQSSVTPTSQALSKDTHGDVATKIQGTGPRYQVGEQDLARLNDTRFNGAYATAVELALRKRGLDVVTPASAGASSAWACVPSCHIPGGIDNATASAFSPRGDNASESITSAPTATRVLPPAYVLDLCGAWGVAGLLAAKLEHRDGTPATRVLALVENKDAAAALNSLAKENGLGRDRYLASAKGIVDLASCCASSARCGEGDPADWFDVVSEAESKEGFDSSSQPRMETSNRHGWSVVLASIVEGSGLLRQGALGDLEFCRRFICCSHESGTDTSTSSTVFVPSSLEITCRGLQRTSLLSENRVISGTGCCRCVGVDVDPVNAFGVTNFRELDLSIAAGIRRESIRQVDGFASAGSVSGAANDMSCAAPGVSDDGDDEAFLTEATVCYDIDIGDVQAGPDGCLARRSAQLRVDRDGVLHAVAYWFRQHLGSSESHGDVDNTLETGPEVGEGPEHGTYSHFRQAAVLLKKPMAVMQGQRINLSVFCTTSQGVVVQVLGITDGQ